MGPGLFHQLHTTWVTKTASNWPCLGNCKDFQEKNSLQRRPPCKFWSRIADWRPGTSECVDRNTVETMDRRPQESRRKKPLLVRKSARRGPFRIVVLQDLPRKTRKMWTRGRPGNQCGRRRSSKSRSEENQRQRGLNFCRKRKDGSMNEQENFLKNRTHP